MLAGGASMVYHFMSDDDVERIMKHSAGRFRVGRVGADAAARACRIRAATATTRACWASTCGTRKVIALEEAIRKMTSLPADHFRFAGRGRLAAGKAADVVVFDPATVADAATFEKPHAYAAGHPARARQRRLRRPRRRRRRTRGPGTLASSPLAAR